MDTVKAAFTSYLSHLAAYVISGVTIVSTLAPGTLPPKYAFLTAIATAMAAAFSHGKAVTANGATLAATMANAFTEAVNSLPTPAPAPAPTASVAAAVKVAVLLLALPVLLSLHACASVQSFLGSPTGQTVVVAGVGVAVTTAEQKGVTAAQLNTVAKTVLAADSGASATMAALTSAVNAAAIKAGVPAGDLAALQGLGIAFDAYIVAKYGSNSTVQNVQADVATFANAVIAATGG